MMMMMGYLVEEKQLAKKKNNFYPSIIERRMFFTKNRVNNRRICLVAIHRLDEFDRISFDRGRKKILKGNMKKNGVTSTSKSKMKERRTMSCHSDE